ncbi:nad dependent epimerase dehydratase family protein [Pochonia chlamydosporia 170]|uniref:Nad dependent epimerase dehydratase family protein n=1 Tax=Pochonia chlamydosporia 170 TaxID=1380566 RepID=A0A179FLL4_METCM|nr:nad dependent epimerase dehydratase family protein [Pochonia chlamydosporia 170]OAQ65933.1 nad dependent epimerase dehydratase family protein [Pochonia chlamydosporia 170]
MIHNLLITGAAGYIGGSVLADFVGRSSDSAIGKANISAIVRREEQIERLQKLGITVICVDLLDEVAIHDIVQSHKIDTIVHLASSHDARIASFLIKALGRRGQDTSTETHFIHASGTTAFAPEAGWPLDITQDTSDIYRTEKKIASDNVIRLTDITVIEEGKANGVATYIVVIPSVYGTGSGEFHTLSIALPMFVRASVKDQRVCRYNKSGKPGAAHISDIVTFYGLLVEKILENKPVPKNENGYYFAVAHKILSQQLMQQIAERLYDLGLVTEPTTYLWPSDETAGASLGLPPQIAHLMGTHSTELVPVKPYELGWKPQWTEEKLFLNLGQEIRDIMELDSATT